MKDCIFCKIVNKEIPAKVIAENERAIAFLDAFPISDGHVLVIPKKHYADLGLCDEASLVDVIKLVKQVSNDIEDTKKLDPWGFNYLSNQGKIAGQEVMHFHMHIIPKYEKDKGFMFRNEKGALNYTTEEVYEFLTKSKAKSKTAKILKKATVKAANTNNKKK